MIVQDWQRHNICNIYLPRYHIVIHYNSFGEEHVRDVYTYVYIFCSFNIGERSSHFNIVLQKCP